MPAREGCLFIAPFAPLHIVSLGGWMSGVAGSAGLWTDIVSITVVLPDGSVVSTGGGPEPMCISRCLINRNLGGPLTRQTVYRRWRFIRY